MINCSHVVARRFRGMIHENFFNGKVSRLLGGSRACSKIYFVFNDEFK